MFYVSKWKVAVLFQQGENKKLIDGDVVKGVMIFCIRIVMDVQVFVLSILNLE